MQKLPVIEIPKSTNRHTQNAVSPFRYPGGKGFLCEFIQRFIEDLNLSEAPHFAEPFCGGAGAALNLLADGHVSSVYLNDLDIRIFSAWNAMLTETERFIERISSIPLTMEEWYAQRDIASAGFEEYSFELGFATFFLNRTTRSGIVDKSGPIGGYAQTGRWKIDARFNREKLIAQVLWIASRRGDIKVSNLDALSFLARHQSLEEGRDFMYFIDPPYVKAGGRLYLNQMDEAKHIALSDLIGSGRLKHWIITYDDNDLIRRLYADYKLSNISVNYSLQNKRVEREIMVLSA